MEMVMDSKDPYQEIKSQRDQLQSELLKGNPYQRFPVPPYYISVMPQGMASRGLTDMILPTTNPIKKYNFSAFKDFLNNFPFYLLPPYGDNLFTIIDHNKELRREIADIFSEYGLNFVAYKKESKFEIEKNIDGYVTKYHYSSMADTFQRLIFYFAVIDSNKDSVLILEEPEVHSFPPYTKDLSERIIASETNQFFITTHSPYLLQNLISSLDSSELNVFVTYYEDYQTKIRKLSDAELKQASDFSVDLFFNLDKFTQHA
jgi:AAA15 family ATPase/GTPase